MSQVPHVPLSDIDEAFEVRTEAPPARPQQDTEAKDELARLLSGTVPPKIADGVIQLESMADVMKMAQHYFKAGMVPDAFFQNTGNKQEIVIRRVAVAIEYGMGVGFTPLQSLAWIMPINGRPMLWGDGVMSLVAQHKAYGGHRVTWTENDSSVTFEVCRVNAGLPCWSGWTYTMADAKLAGLLGKGMAWPKHTRRMMFNRARAFALRDAFPDALRGAGLADEVLDDQLAEKLAGEEKTAQLEEKVREIVVEKA